VTVPRAEVNGGNLRIEGTAAANRTITVDGVAMGASDGAGRFRVERAGFPAPANCTVAVNDGSATAATATLAGCTVSAPSPSTTPSLAALTLSQTTVVGGTRVTATVSLTSSAPGGGVVVSLSSNNPTAATVPPSVTVPAGSTAATFTVTTNPVANSQSSTIIGTAGGATQVRHPDRDDRVPGHQRECLAGQRGDRGRRVTSQPAGIDCTFTATETTSTCGNVFFPAGTQVRLEARPAQGSSFLGWSSRPPVGTLPRSRWPLAWPTSAARYSG
jgi:hypothetical protein